MRFLEVEHVRRSGELPHPVAERAATEVAARTAQHLCALAPPAVLGPYVNDLEREVEWGQAVESPLSACRDGRDLDAMGAQAAEQRDRAATWSSALEQGRLCEHDDDVHPGTRTLVEGTVEDEAESSGLPYSVQTSRSEEELFPRRPPIVGA